MELLFEFFSTFSTTRQLILIGGPDCRKAVSYLKYCFAIDILSRRQNTYLGLIAFLRGRDTKINARYELFDLLPQF